MQNRKHTILQRSIAFSCSLVTVPVPFSGYGDGIGRRTDGRATVLLNAPCSALWLIGRNNMHAVAVVSADGRITYSLYERARRRMNGIIQMTRERTGRR